MLYIIAIANGYVSTSNNKAGGITYMLHVTVNYTEECNVLCDYSKNTQANDLTKKAAIALEKKEARLQNSS